jgi:hypothetical protein
MTVPPWPPGRGGQGDHDLLVVLGELPGTLLLGQVEVAEDLVADADRWWGGTRTTADAG